MKTHDHAAQLAEALRALSFCACTFRNVPKDEQEWTSIDDDAMHDAQEALAAWDRHNAPAPEQKAPL